MTIQTFRSICADFSLEVSHVRKRALCGATISGNSRHISLPMTTVEVAKPSAGREGAVPGRHRLVPPMGQERVRSQRRLRCITWKLNPKPGSPTLLRNFELMKHP